MVESFRIEFTESLEHIADEVVRLGAMVNETIARGTAALLAADLTAAQEVIRGDDAIDFVTQDVEERCYQLLARQNPVARDLRFIVTSIRIVSELERSADLIVNTVKALRRIYGVQFDPKVRGLIDAMATEAQTLTEYAIKAYREGDASLAAALDDIDDRLDDLHEDYIESVIESHRAEHLTLQAAVQLALIGRYFERIGDHAVNIGERVSYMVTGELPDAPIPEEGINGDVIGGDITSLDS